MKGFAWFLCLLMALCAGVALAAEWVDVPLDMINATAAFPEDWIVTPSRELATDLKGEGVVIVGTSPAGDVTLRVLAQSGDAEQDLLYDIDRYTPAQRSAMRNDFMNRSVWAITGRQYTEAEWTNREGQGRLLWLSYIIRYEEEIVVRGRSVFTIRNGLSLTLDLQVNGRRLEAADEKIFATFVSRTALPESSNMPLLPVGIVVNGSIPEETHRRDLTLTGTTMGKARVQAWLSPLSGTAVLAGDVDATNAGNFTLTVTLPGEGEYRLYVTASKDGFAASDESAWISYTENRIPVNLTSTVEGVVTASQPRIEGKTLSGSTIQFMEGDTNTRVVVGSDGRFSYKVDRTMEGPRQITMAITRKDFPDRRILFDFDRQWLEADYIQYLQTEVSALSYERFSAAPAQFAGRTVAFTGLVTEISSVAERVYIQLATKGENADRLIFIQDGGTVWAEPGDRVKIYGRVTGGAYTFTDIAENGDQVVANLPSLVLLVMERGK